MEERHREEGLVLLALSTDDPAVRPKIPEFLKTRGIHAKVLLGDPRSPKGYETHPGALYVIDRQGILADTPGDGTLEELETGEGSRLANLLEGKPTPGPLLWTVEKAPPGFGLLWKQPLDSPVIALAVAPSSKSHPADIGVANGTRLLRYSASGTLLGDSPLEAEKLEFLEGADLDGDGKNEWIAAAGSSVTLLDGAGEEYWNYAASRGAMRVAAVMDLDGDGSREIVLQDGPSIVAKKALPGVLWRSPSEKAFRTVVPDPSGFLLAQGRDGIQALDGKGLPRGRPSRVAGDAVLRGRIAREGGGFLDVFGPDDTVVDVRHDLDGDGRRDILVSDGEVVAVYSQDGSPLLILRIASNRTSPRVALADLDGRPGDEMVLAIPDYGLVALGISPQAKPVAGDSAAGDGRPAGKR